MTSEELRPFQRQLEALAHELEAALAQEDPTRDSITPDNAIGRLTRMEAIQAQEMTAEGRRRAAARLQQVRKALELVAQGTYGQCVRCGAEIPKGRLEIMPETRLCVTCSARRR